MSMAYESMLHRRPNVLELDTVSRYTRAILTHMSIGYIVYVSLGGRNSLLSGS